MVFAATAVLSTLSALGGAAWASVSPSNDNFIAAAVITGKGGSLRYEP